MLVDDRIKPPVTGSLPPLPPYLRSAGKPRKPVRIVFDIRFFDIQHTIYDHENNWQTVVYSWMNRITGEGSLFDPNNNLTFEVAHAHSREYRRWLETYQTDDGVPPHITFGGAIKSGTGDPTFYPRWKDWAREYFA